MESSIITQIICAGIYGAIMGSFINAVAMRTVKEEKWWGAERSKCDTCGKELTPLELIPIISYLLQKGKCKKCGAKIPKRHIYTETISAIIAILIVHKFGISVETLFGLVLLPFIIFHSLTDIEEQYIYDAWAYAMGIAGITLRIMGGIPGLLDGIYGALLGFSVIYIICKISRGGMGFGDALLMIGFGSFFGLKLTIAILYIGFTIGAVVSLVLIALKKVTRKSPLPLAPFLSVASIITLLYGEEIISLLPVVISLQWPWS